MARLLLLLTSYSPPLPAPSPLDSRNVSYIALIQSKLVHASVAWSSFTLADSNKLKTYKESWQMDAAVDLFSPVFHNYEPVF
jgi:hypothetical protein